MVGSRGGRPLRGALGAASRMAFVALQCNSLTPLGVEKGACAPNMARKGFRCMLFICAVSNRGVWVLFKEKGLITITKAAWQVTVLLERSLPGRLV